MKKRFFAMFSMTAVLAAALALCACSVPPAASSQGSAQGAADSVAAAQEAPPAAPLRTLALQGWYGSTNAAGYYGITHPQNGECFGWRVNFATGMQEKLCAVAGCDHTQETCGARVDIGVVVHDGKILADEDKLYWLFYRGGHNGMKDDLSRPTIDVSDLDGGNRRRLLTLPEGSFLGENLIVTDGEILYATLLYSSQDRTQHDPRFLVGVDMDTGEIVMQYEMTDIMPAFLGAYDGKLLFEATILAPDCPEPARYEKYNFLANRETLEPYMRHVLYTLTTDGTQCEAIYTAQQAQPWGRYSDGALYFPNQEAHTLIARDIATGAETVAAQNLPADAQFLDVYTNYITFCTTDDLERGYGRTLHMADRATGEVRENPLRRIQKMEPSCPTVLCEAGDDFFVISDETPVTLTGIGTGGTPYQFETVRETYSLIDQRAFFEGAPDYRTVQTLPDTPCGLS